MLRELRIENFAIIRELDLVFKPGLIVLTGETGAGKSIIMGALDMLLGQRVDMTHLRTGSERATVEAVFRIPDAVRDPITSLLAAEDVFDDQDFVTLTRELRRDRRNVARVNGHRANVSLLVQLGEYLVDIHGQSDHLSLLRVNQHLELLDRYADLQELRSEFQSTFDRLRQVREEMQRLKEMDREAAQRTELLQFQVEEIEAAQLVEGEDEDLVEQVQRLANAEKLAERSQEALMLLEDAPPSQPTMSDLMGQVVDLSTSLAKMDPSLEEMNEELQEMAAGLEDWALELHSYLDTLEFDPDELERVEERLALIRDLKRKYGESIPEIKAHAEQARDELTSISNRSERISALAREEASLLERLGQQGRDLSRERQQAAEQLEKSLEEELEDLRMAEARFKVNFRQVEDPEGVKSASGSRVKFTRSGVDEVEFLIETNPGEGLKPLAKVASGGETARLMLAIKNVLAKADHISTLVFDEIDQGIGGRIGAVVGEKLRRLTRGHQVICITHLPQLASFAHQHFQVAKQVEGERTTITVGEMTGENRLHELAEMLGGISDHNLQSARELLESVDKTAGLVEHSN